MDRLDLIAKVQVYFRVLEYLQPDQPWGWEHPMLVDWMNRYGIQSKWHMEEEHLQVLVSSLEKTYGQCLKAYQEKERRRLNLTETSK